MVTDNLVPHFSSIHAIDVSPSMLLTFASRHSNPHITHSLHFLTPSSPSEFLTPLLSPLPAEQARRLQPPRAKYGVAVANLVLHHVDDWAGMMAGVQGLLVPGGWFVGTEFGREEGERDRVKEAREIVAAKKREAAGEGAQVSLSSLLTSLSPRGPGRPEVWKC
jgi:SAM-dependent methyltransferase